MILIKGTRGLSKDTASPGESRWGLVRVTGVLDLSSLVDRYSHCF